jgi:hypothetical protein
MLSGVIIPLVKQKQFRYSYNLVYNETSDNLLITDINDEKLSPFLSWN